MKLKRITALMLSLVMIFTCMPSVNVNAEETPTKYKVTFEYDGNAFDASGKVKCADWTQGFRTFSEISVGEETYLYLQHKNNFKIVSVECDDVTISKCQTESDWVNYKFVLTEPKNITIKVNTIAEYKVLFEDYYNANGNFLTETSVDGYVKFPDNIYCPDNMIFDHYEIKNDESKTAYYPGQQVLASELIKYCKDYIGSTTLIIKPVFEESDKKYTAVVKHLDGSYTKIGRYNLGEEIEMPFYNVNLDIAPLHQSLKGYKLYRKTNGFLESDSAIEPTEKYISNSADEQSYFGTYIVFAIYYEYTTYALNAVVYKQDGEFLREARITNSSNTLRLEDERIFYNLMYNGTYYIVNPLNEGEELLYIECTNKNIYFDKYGLLNNTIAKFNMVSDDEETHIKIFVKEKDSENKKYKTVFKYEDGTEVSFETILEEEFNAPKHDDTRTPAGKEFNCWEMTNSINKSVILNEDQVFKLMAYYFENGFYVDNQLTFKATYKTDGIVKYHVNVIGDDHCQVAPIEDKAAYETVTLNVTYDSGYELDKFITDDPITITDNKFNMITKDVTIKVLSKAKSSGGSGSGSRGGSSKGGSSIKDTPVAAGLEKQIILTIGSKIATVFGVEKELDVAPEVTNNRTMLPIRFVAENLGCTVNWSAEKPELVEIIKGDKTIILTIGSNIATVNGVEYELDQSAYAHDNRTFVPVRFIAENLGCKVDWNEETPDKVVIIME